MMLFSSASKFVNPQNWRRMCHTVLLSSIQYNELCTQMNSLCPPYLVLTIHFYALCRLYTSYSSISPHLVWCSLTIHVKWAMPDYTALPLLYISRNIHHFSYLFIHILIACHCLITLGYHNILCEMHNNHVEHTLFVRISNSLNSFPHLFHNTTFLTYSSTFL